GTQHAHDPPISDEFGDRVGGVRRIDDHALTIVADDPDVVVDAPCLAVEAERPARHGVVDSHRITTDLSTSPRCIFSNAASMSPTPIFSVTNSSSGSRPWRYRSMRSGKSRDGRQSPYHDDLSAPPRPKKSISGRSRR